MKTAFYQSVDNKGYLLISRPSDVLTNELIP